MDAIDEGVVRSARSAGSCLVIRPQPADRDALRGVPSVRVFEKAHRRRLLVIGKHLGAAHAGAIVTALINRLVEQAEEMERDHLGAFDQPNSVLRMNLDGKAIDNR